MTEKKNTGVYILIHMLFWCSYVITWSYTAVYLEYYGFDNFIVGIVTGVGAVVSVFLQPFLASLVKKNGKLTTKKSMLFLKVLAAVIAIIMWFEPPKHWIIAICFLIIAAIDATIPSILSSLAMEQIHIGRQINYGLARGVGSIVFALSSLAIGYVIKGIEMKWLIFLYAGVSLLVVVMGFFFDDGNGFARVENTKTEDNKNGILKKYPFLLSFLLATVLFFMGHNMINMFLVRIIERAGGSSKNLGVALAIAAVLELPVMGAFNWISKKVSIQKILLISAVCFVLKCILTYLSHSLIIVYIAQVLQIGAFGLYTPASVYFINKAMKKEDSGVGQALLGAFSLGLGGAIGNIFGGLIIDSMQVGGMLMFSIILSAAGFLFMLECLRKYKKYS